MSSIRTIAIIGATGMLGRPVTHELINAGFSVRIIARNPVEARRLFPQADIVTGDLADVNSLVPALQGQDAVYLNLSVRQTERPTDFHTETDGIRNLLDAARQTGVKRIGYLSSLVMNYQGINDFYWWVFGIKHEAVQLLKSSGIPYSIFYPSTFMESLLHTQRQGRLIMLAGTSPVQLYYIAGQDYGRQVARAFQLAEDGQNQEYVIQGPEPVTQTEAARQLSQHYTKAKLFVMTTPHWVMKMAGQLSPLMSYGAHITEALNNYREQFTAEKTWQDLGKPTLTIKDFARQA
ncbi:hypothetical protein GCM10023189_28660 [Nibrella saemangeumensis]|uniref:NAD(P)-binding domain-containing protein n=1 Tax=Nibrella saemangeumensis TaxID=1084526 RepID=A0ABP8N1E9_9BACT